MKMKHNRQRGHVCICLTILLFCALNVHAKIVFDAKQKHLGDKFYHVYAMEDDGSNLRRITPSHRYDIASRWFPDGKRIVFKRDWGKGKFNTVDIVNFELFIIDETGRNEHSFMVNRHRTDKRPDPSPDGRHIVFDSFRTGELDIYTYDLARDKITALTNNKIEGGYTQAPRWSPDGSRIVYHNGQAIWVMNANGGKKEQIIPPPATHTVRGYACWSPSGRYIMYYEADLKPVASRIIVHKVSTKMRDVYRLPTPEGKYGQVGGLAWMGDDNTALLSYEEAGGALNIYRYDLNSRRMTKLTNFPQGHAYFPHWVEGTLAVSPLDKVTTRWGYLKQELAQ